MYDVAKTLVALSTKGTLIATAVILATTLTLGYFVTMWIFYIPLGLLCLRLTFTLLAVISSANKIGWSPTFKEIMIQIELIQDAEAEEAAASNARTKDLKAKLPEGSWGSVSHGEKPKPCPKLRCHGSDGPGWNRKQRLKAVAGHFDLEDDKSKSVVIPIAVKNGDVQDNESEPERPKLRLVSNGDTNGND